MKPKSLESKIKLIKIAKHGNKNFTGSTNPCKIKVNQKSLFGTFNINPENKVTFPTIFHFL